MSATSPFLLENEELYQSWRKQKLANYPTNIQDFIVEIEDINTPTHEEIETINTLINKTNLIIYKTKNAPTEDKAPFAVQNLMKELGLYRCETHRSQEDHGLVRLEVDDSDHKKEFIPYTSKALNWHTDGYYNKQSSRIKAFSMHCVRPASEGGVNSFFDHELAYIRMRDENHDYIKAFRQRRAMCIPPFVNENGEARQECPGGVFGIDRFYGSLHMRFTARKHNVNWRDDAKTKETFDFLMSTLKSDPLVMSYKLEAGEGILCNNVLHNRTAFADDSNNRLMLRGRYLERIGDVCPDATQLANKQYNAGVWS